MSTNEPRDRRERRRLKTADRLAIEAFAFIEKVGIDRVSMEEVAQSVDISRATLYNHFASKEALVAHFIGVEFERGWPALESRLQELPDVESQLFRMFGEFASWAQKRRAYLPLALKHSLSAHSAGGETPKRSKLGLAFESILRQGQLRGEVSSEWPCDTLSRALEYQYLAATLQWLQSSVASPKEEFDQMLRLFLNGARTGRVSE